MSFTDKKITLLTGAGISSESGIPTFRGPEGYWTMGSRHYHPQEMASYAMFARRPWEVWAWYLNRLCVYRDVRPNPGHLAIVEMEHCLQDRFRLVTQNVDNLHLQAGNSLERIYQIHGNIYFMRCSRECQGRIYPLPVDLLSRETNQALTQAEKKQLSCPDCGRQVRPHVLWFDECYDEHYFKYESALNVANETDVLIVVGTSGATTLPNLIANAVYENKGRIIDINIEENPFSRLAVNSVSGKFLNTTCSEGLQLVLELIRKNDI
jgi:NAD-dependent deacetylase